MALSKEDKKDVSDAMGKAIANKIAGVTSDALQRRREIAEKHAQGFYVGGRPIEQGKTKAQSRADEKADYKRHKALSPQERMAENVAAFHRIQAEQQGKSK